MLRDATARELAEELVKCLGRNDEGPLGPCKTLEHGGGCTRRYGIAPGWRFLSFYCAPCKAYVIATKLRDMFPDN